MKGALPPDDWPNRNASRIVQLAPHRWHVQQTGTGPDALLLHGAGASAHSWAPLVPHLENDHRLFMPDMPGHGFTQSPKGRARLPDFARDLGALVADQLIRPKLLIGHSAGGAVALEMVRLGLIRPGKIVILNGALEDFRGAAGFLFPVIAKVLALNPLTGLFLSSGAQSLSQARSMVGTTGSELPDAQLRPYAQLIGKRSHVDGTLGMMAQWSLTELNRALPRITTPTLFLHGVKDSAVDASVAERAVAAMPDARLIMIDKAGHLAHEEAPFDVAAHIRAFMVSNSAQ